MGTFIGLVVFAVIYFACKSSFNNKVDKFSSFMGATPMTVIIKNKKMVHGYIGTMSVDTLYTIKSLYGVINIRATPFLNIKTSISFLMAESCRNL
mgnify:CR=1 FL=1